MADRIAVMRDGRLQQFAEPDVAYRRPANLFVAEFLGSPAMNTVRASLATNGDGSTVRLGDRNVVTLPADVMNGSSAVVAGLRPEDLTVGGSEEVSIGARVTEVEYQGNGNFVFLETDELDSFERAAGEDDAGEDTDRAGADDPVRLIARAPTSVRPEPGEALSVTTDREDVYLFDAESGDAIHR